MNPPIYIYIAEIVRDASMLEIILTFISNWS